ncbi:hypothetical protein Tco_0484951 [Tanacetum coccineum]
MQDGFTIGITAMRKVWDYRWYPVFAQLPELFEDHAHPKQGYRRCQGTIWSSSSSTSWIRRDINVGTDEYHGRELTFFLGASSHRRNHNGGILSKS